MFDPLLDLLKQNGVLDDEQISVILDEQRNDGGKSTRQIVIDGGYITEDDLLGMMAAYLVANPDAQLEAAAASVALMGVAGEIGWENMLPGDGNSTYRNRIIDAIFNMDAETLEARANYEIF